ncbi:hypothetical protein [Chitinophaga agri]|uniref:Uncharacterized protein n=1 Tax=Chitinophaga agri TaxID=2703787 RepID=A0A6B9ZCK4_9BACT|nr:hypothetical protein [Chitinophaga agri]QHS58323.1 hypothetical protein GWR21_01555 [Chitinophaga agri]
MKIIQFLTVLTLLCLTGLRLIAQRSYLYVKEDTCYSCGQRMRGYTIDYLSNYFCVHRDSLVFSVPHERISFGSHGSYKRATRFAMQLPLHLQETFISGFYNYAFNFPDYENIAIKMNNYIKGPQIDSNCTPNADDIDNLIRHIDFFDDIDVSLISDRITELFFRNGQAILLLNIKKENYSRFLKAVNSFRITDLGEWTQIKGKEVN